MQKATRALQQPALLSRRNLVAAAAVWPAALAWRGTGAQPAAPTTAQAEAQAAFDAARAQPGALVRMPPGRITLSGTLEILDAQNWIMDNTLIVHNGKGPAIRTRAREWSLTGNGRIVGAGADMAGNSGLLIEGGRAYRVSGVYFHGFGGTALEIVDDLKAFSVPRGDRGQFSDLSFAACATAVDIKPAAEYSVFTNTTIRGCRQGAVVAGGNTQFIGGNMVDCEDGFVLVGGQNHGHGGVQGFNINHCKRYALFANEVANGFSFNGCNFYSDGPTSGAIYLKDSAGILVQGGHVDCPVIVEGKRGSHVLANNLMPGKNFSIASSTGDRARVVCRGNTRPDGGDACRAG